MDTEILGRQPHNERRKVSTARKHLWVLVADDGFDGLDQGVNFGTLEDGKVKYRLTIDAIGEWRDLGYKPDDVIKAVLDYLNKNFSEVYK